MDEGDAAAESDGLARPQRRLLRRIFNGRTTPVIVGDSALLTYRDASRLLLSLPIDARDIAYATIRRLAQGEVR